MELSWRCWRRCRSSARQQPASTLGRAADLGRLQLRGGVEGGASGFYHRGKFAYVRTRETCDEGKILCISAEDTCVSRRYRTYLTKISHVSYEDTAALLLDAENRAYLTKISRVSCEDIACILRRYRAYLHVISSNHIPHVPDCYTRSPPPQHLPLCEPWL